MVSFLLATESYIHIVYDCTVSNTVPLWCAEAYDTAWQVQLETRRLQNMLTVPPPVKSLKYSMRQSDFALACFSVHRFCLRPEFWPIGSIHRASVQCRHAPYLAMSTLPLIIKSPNPPLISPCLALPLIILIKSPNTYTSMQRRSCTSISSAWFIHSPDIGEFIYIMKTTKTKPCSTSFL